MIKLKLNPGLLILRFGFSIALMTHGYGKFLRVINGNFKFSDQIGIRVAPSLILASDLEYVHDVIKPSLTFDPYSTQSISNAILKAIETDNLPETKGLVENKLYNFIYFIIN